MATPFDSLLTAHVTHLLSHFFTLTFQTFLAQMEDEGHYKEWYYDDELGTWQIAGYVLQDEFIKFLTVKV